MLSYLTRKRGETMENYFVKKIMDRLFKLACHRSHEKGMERGRTCLNAFNSEANPEDSQRFFTLLLESWKFWGETYRNTSTGRR